jgi:hypothetical protein
MIRWSEQRNKAYFMPNSVRWLEDLPEAKAAHRAAFCCDDHNGTHALESDRADERGESMTCGDFWVKSLAGYASDDRTIFRKRLPITASVTAQAPPYRTEHNIRSR